MKHYSNKLRERWARLYPFVPYDVVSRMIRTESDNRRRARRKGYDYEKIDWIAICIEDGWLCCICGQHMDMTLPGNHAMGVTLEHKLSLGQGGGHLAANVGGAHRSCNVRKGQELDGPAAAACKRKAGGRGSQYARRKKRGGSSIVSRNSFSKPSQSWGPGRALEKRQKPPGKSKYKRTVGGKTVLR